MLDQYKLGAKLLHQAYLILRETIKQRAAEAPATLAGRLHLAGRSRTITDSPPGRRAIQVGTLM